MRADPARLIGIGLLAGILTGCGGNVRDSAPSGSAIPPDLPGDAIPKPEPRSRYGNGPVYEVLDRRYRVLDSASGYSERGVASWYGRKFHGRPTSSMEPYDMYRMTAAHKTLPLPTYVRVRNLRNNRAIVVRVNDRGPFVDNRIIDLSYVAALKLGMIRDGTSLVEVTAITFDKSGQPEGDRPTRQVEPPAPPASTPSAQATPPADTEEREARVYAQVGAFGTRENAERRRRQLRAAHIRNIIIAEDRATDPPLFRVRIGPIQDGEQYDVIVEELAKLGIADPYLVTD